MFRIVVLHKTVTLASRSNVHGQDIVKPRTVVKCLWEDAFGVLLDKLDMPETTIDNVQIATNEKPTVVILCIV